MLCVHELDDGYNKGETQVKRIYSECDGAECNLSNCDVPTYNFN